MNKIFQSSVSLRMSLTDMRLLLPEIERGVKLRYNVAGVADPTVPELD